jgi:putative N6-adenine-specific DNA methylase
MTKDKDFEIFLVTAPGLEAVLLEEVRLKGFKQAKSIPGGVTFEGGWPEVWRANLWVRGAGRVLARIASFKTSHLSQLESRARHVPWNDVLRPDFPFRVAATCTKSQVYHAGAAAERIQTAICETLGAAYSPEAEIVIMARIERDVCTISIDTSGEPLYKRGYKEAVNKAPMRETMAALFLRQCGYNGLEPVFDPMCGSGTFIIEAAEIAARLNPGRTRHFAFEKFANFDVMAWQRMLEVKSARVPTIKFYGSDRDAGAIDMSCANAVRAGVESFTEFKQCSISDIVPPSEIPGLVIVNPPYGARLGDKKKLFSLYSTLGRTLAARFAGWRVGIIAADHTLANMTELPFLSTASSVRVTLFQTNALPEGSQKGS